MDSPLPTPSPAIERLPQPKRSILVSVVRQSLIISAVTIGLLSLISFVLARSLTTQQRFFEQLSLIATERKNIIDTTVQEALRIASVVSKSIDGTRDASDLQYKLEQGIATIGTNTGMRVVGLSVFDLKRKLVTSSGERSSGFYQARTNTYIEPTIDAKLGWKAMTVYTPLRDSNDVVWGTLAVQYDTTPLLERVFADLTQSLGRTAEITLAREQGGEIFVVHHSQSAQTLKSYPLGDLMDPYIQGSPIADAVTGKTGVSMTRDDAGRKVLVAYEYLDTLGWGLTIQIASTEALAGITMLATTLIAISVFMLFLAGLVGFFFARHLTEPLLHLVGKIRVLRPGHWTFRLSIRTGDEVEMLDHVIADLTSRLQATYEQLEGKVADTSTKLKKQVVMDRAILESIAHGVFATDPTGVITDCNDSANRLLGFSKEECIGQNAISLLQLHYQKGSFSATDHPVAVCLKNHATFRSPATMHMTVLCKNQTLLPIMMMVTPLLEDGILMGTIVIFLDVTEERQTDYMKSEFISLASHQLRTPLSSLRWYLELLTGDTEVKLTNEQEEYLSEVQKACVQMASLLDTLLRVARLDEGGMMIERKEVEVIEMLDRLFDEIRQGNHDKRLAFRAELPKTQLKMMADPVLLPVVVQNLVTNAMKYSTHGGEILLSITDEPKVLKIHVTDHGVGIPPEEQPRVFEKFFRAKNTQSLSTPGTGLGLYLSKRIMDSMGGTLSFVSEPGKGSTFTATVPKE